MELFSYKNSDAIVVLSRGVEKYIRDRGGKNIYWLPNGADTEKFYFSVLPKEDSSFNFERPFLVIYSGAHGEANGLSVLIEAARILQNKPIKFLLIGDGPEKNKLIKLAKFKEY